MLTRLMKVSTGSGEQRWINLDRVTRISKATDNSGEPILAFCFDGQDKVTLHGNDKESCGLIQRITDSLDSIAESTSLRRAA